MVFVFSVYVLVLLIIGYLASRKGNKTANDFLTSSRDHGTWLASLSASAASESGWVTLGLCGAAFSSGVSTMWLLPGCLLGYVFNWYVLGRRIHRLTGSSASSTLSEVLVSSFTSASSAAAKSWVQRAIAFSTVLFLAFYASAQFSATGKALSVMFGWEYRTGVVLGSVVVLGYTAMGGLRAGSWTDVPKAVLMFLSLVVLPFVIIASTDLEEGFFEDLQAVDPHLLSWTGNSSGWGILGFILGWVGIGLGYPGQPQILRRFMSTSSSHVYKSAPYIAIVWSQLSFFGAIFIGLAARLRFPGLSDPEQALPHAAVQLLSPALAGLALTGVLSAMWSTANGQLFEASMALLELCPSWKRMPSIAPRISVIIVGLFACGLAYVKVQIVYDVVLYSWGALGSGIGTAVVMALLWRKSTPQGVLTGLIVGPMTLVLWRSVFHLSGFLYELIPAFGFALVSIWVVSNFTRITDSKVTNFTCQR